MKQRGRRYFEWKVIIKTWNIFVVLTLRRKFCLTRQFKKIPLLQHSKNRETLCLSNSTLLLNKGDILIIKNKKDFFFLAKLTLRGNVKVESCLTYVIYKVEYRNDTNAGVKQRPCRGLTFSSYIYRETQDFKTCKRFAEKKIVF